MKKSARFLFAAFALALFACNSSTETKQTTEEKPISVDSVIVQPTAPVSTLAADNGKDCKREVATPVVKKSVYPKTTFQLQADKLTAIETVELDNGDKLIIKNWGCKYYALTFRFETTRFQKETTNVGFWYKRAVTFVNEVSKGIDAPIEIGQATEILVGKIEEDVPNAYQNLKFGEEIEVANGNVPEFVSVDKVEQLSDQKFAVEVTIARGPL